MLRIGQGWRLFVRLCWERPHRGQGDASKPGVSLNSSFTADACTPVKETTTTTTMWFKTPAYRRTLELHAQLLEAIWVDGYTMAAEFQSWLQTRVLAILVGITVGLPTLVAICYRYSSRFRRWLLEVKIVQLLFFGRVRCCEQ